MNKINKLINNINEIFNGDGFYTIEFKVAGRKEIEKIKQLFDSPNLTQKLFSGLPFAYGYEIELESNIIHDGTDINTMEVDYRIVGTDDLVETKMILEKLKTWFKKNKIQVEYLRVF